MGGRRGGQDPPLNLERWLSNHLSTARGDPVWHGMARRRDSIGIASELAVSGASSFTKDDLLERGMA